MLYKMKTKYMHLKPGDSVELFEEGEIQQLIERGIIEPIGSKPATAQIKSKVKHK